MDTAAQDPLAALKAAVMASDRRMEWEQGRRRSSRSWRIMRQDQPTWVYVWAVLDRFRVKYVSDDGNEAVRHCGNATDAVALAERFSLADFD